MTKRLSYTLLASVSLLVFTFLFASSCKRNKECDAVINVVDGQTGSPVSGASVDIFPSKTAPQGNLAEQTQTGMTDASGSISFHFKVPAILKVNAAGNGKWGTEYVHLEEGKSVSQTVKIY